MIVTTLAYRRAVNNAMYFLEQLAHHSECPPHLSDLARHTAAHLDNHAYQFVAYFEEHQS